MLRRAALAVLPVSLVLLLAVAAGGCGEDSLSAGQLRTRAAAICTQTATAMDRIRVPDTPERGERFLGDGAAALRPALAKLKRLKPPPDMRASYAQAVKLGTRELTLITRNAHAIGAGTDAIAAFRRLQRQLTSVTQIEDATWRALEVPACVRR